MKTEHFIVSTLDFFRVFLKNFFFPKFELLKSGCGLSASAAYLRVFKVLVSVVSAWHMVRESFLFKPNVKLRTFKFILLDQV